MDKVYKKFGLAKEEYEKLRYGFLPQFVLHTDEHLAAALYFDGDDGVVDELGFSITLIDCKYCDISMTEMLDIAHTLDDLKNTGDKE